MLPSSLLMSALSGGEAGAGAAAAGSGGEMVGLDLPDDLDDVFASMTFGPSATPTGGWEVWEVWMHM